MPITIIRGLPGSGKSTLAKAMVERGECDVHLETDMWFCSPSGEYRFDPSRLGANHAKCFEAAQMAVAAGLHPVVSNTFTRLWEMEPYLSICDDVRVILARGSYGNIHGVPDIVVRSMSARWEEYV